MAWSNSKGRGTKYGAEHLAARKVWLQQTTPASPCVRCGRPLGPSQRVDARGRTIGLWHLDHAENGGYLGFSHGSCNVSAGSSKGARIANARRKVTTLRW